MTADARGMTRIQVAVWADDQRGAVRHHVQYCGYPAEDASYWLRWIANTQHLHWTARMILKTRGYITKI